MNIKEIVDNMKSIQKYIINFIENEDMLEEYYQNLGDIITKQKIHENKYLLISTLHLLTEIGNYHERCSNFFEKIEKIIIIFQDPIKKFFSNSQIFNIFKSNKRILLFLFKEKMINIDDYINKKITKRKNEDDSYSFYFTPEINPSEKLPECFHNNRQLGENESRICKIIQKDLIEDFIIYVNKNSCSVNSIIEESKYETNSFLIKKLMKLKRIQNNRFSIFKKKSQNDVGITFIEYASFFGSIQIFRYLKINGAHLEPSLWPFAIHGNNPEIIYNLEENNIKPENESYLKCLKEAIKCHHNDIANYIINNYLPNEYEITKESFKMGLKYYNFDFIDKYYICQSFFTELVKYDYPIFVEFLLNNIYIDINHTMISSKKIFIKFLILFMFQ